MNYIKAIPVVISSTNMGFVTALEKKTKLKSKLHPIGCSFYQNEPPFKDIFEYIDGTTRSTTIFTGLLGNIFRNNYQDLPQIEFNTINSPLDDLYLTLGAMEYLRGIRRPLLEYTVGISQEKCL